MGYEKGYIRTDSGLWVDKGNQVVDVRHTDFAGGARLDGVYDDTAAVQAAIDFCNNRGGGTVFIPQGERGGPCLLSYKDPTLGHKLRVYDNVRIKGAGMDVTTITVPADHGDWDIFRPIGGVTNFAIEDLTYDGNGDANLMPAAAHYTQGLFYGDASVNRLFIARVRGTNVAGERVVTAVGTDVVIENSFFDPYVDGNTSLADHSTLFVVADRVRIIRNTLRSATQSQVATAIESHGENSVVGHNVIDGFNVGIIIAGIFGDTRAAVYTANSMKNVRGGYRLYCDDDHYMDCLIEGGSISQTGDPFAIIDLDYCTTPADRIVIRGVEMANVDATPAGDEGDGISVGRVRYLRVEGCGGYDLSGSFIARGENLGGWEGDDDTDIDVIGNTLRNCGRTSAGTPHDDYMSFFATEALNSVKVIGNTLHHPSASAKKWLSGNAPTAVVVSKNNTVIGLADGVTGGWDAAISSLTEDGNTVL